MIKSKYIEGEYNMAVQISLCVLAVLTAALFIAIRVTKGGTWGIVTKTLASFCFVLYGALSFTQITWYTKGSVFIILGLICGLIGDIILDLKYVYKEHNDIYLNTGMLAFGIGHIFYFIGTVLISQSVIKLWLPIVVALAVASVLTPIIYLVSKKLMGLDYGKFAWQSMIYCFILTFMSVFTIYLACLQLEFLILAAGITMILLSDLVLSTQYFGGKVDDKFCTIVNHAVYYAGQILIATFLYLF